jgi:flagellar export protein FliJ
LKKFVFRFQALLDTKKHLEEKCEDELAVLTRKQREVEAVLNEMEDRLARYYEEYCGNRKATIEEIRRYRCYFDKLNEDIELQKEVKANCADEVEMKRAELMAVQKEKLALEKLMEKDYCRYQQKMMTWERKFLDEIATAAFIRRGGDENIC